MIPDITRRLLAIVALIGGAAAHADCGSQSSLVFSCATAQGHRVELCDEGPTIRYSFGEAGTAPQVAVTMPRDEVRLAPLRAFGKIESYAVRIPYREATHVIFWSLADAGDEPEAGVQVFVDGALRTTLQCVPTQIRNNIPKAGFKGG